MKFSNGKILFHVFLSSYVERSPVDYLVLSNPESATFKYTWYVSKLDFLETLNGKILFIY